VTKHDDLLDQGPHEAPEPETAEQRSKRKGWGAAGGGVLGGGLVLAKFGGLAKVFIWLFAFHAIGDAWRIGSWVGIAVVVALVAAFILLHERRQV
jgi:hypothetical protein